VTAPAPSTFLGVTPIALASGGRRAARLLERNVLVYRRQWVYLVSGFFEPLFYLLSIGVGLNHLVGAVHAGGRPVAYASYVAPGLLAAAAMNGALFDATFGMFFKLKIAKTFEAVLATPLGARDVVVGELAWALLRGSLYAASFVVVMAALGYLHSAWALLSLPAAVLVSGSFGAIGMAATSYMRSWQDFDLVSLGMLPLFLFSATFYPLSVYPGWLQLVVRCTPLYQGVALQRGLCLGGVSWMLAAHAAYLLVMGGIGFAVTSGRLARLLLS
jgi:lipooligosaccharide transport system permease protein